MQSADPNQRIDVINALRAFAAMFVAWGHFAVAAQGHWLGLSGHYGYLGVHIFFVISGFVIPWSLYRSNYILRDYPRFLLKRNVRLYPPYVASIAVAIAASYFIMVPLLHFQPVAASLRDLLLNLLYLNDIVGVPWINVVYWTLAIEFQWYLLIGLMTPLLASRKPVTRFLAIVAMMAAYFCLHNDKLIFHSIPIFMVGVFVFQYRARIISAWQMLGFIAAMVLAMQGPISGVVAVVSAVAGLVIAFVRFNNPVANRLGDVSYSLYLLHIPIGVSVVGLLSSRLPFSGSYIGLLDVVGLAASVGAAAVMYHFIEKPSQELSSAIRFVHRVKPPVRQESAKPMAVGAGAGD